MQGSAEKNYKIQVVSDLHTYTSCPWNLVQWNISLIRSLYSGPTDECTHFIDSNSILVGNDRIIWMGNPSGLYTATLGFCHFFIKRYGYNLF